MDEEIIAQLGLLLSQVRYTRRAVEDIERSTARYGSFAFSAALQAGPKFGEPPLQNGALRVWVMNIADLAPSGGLGGLFGSLLGGVGRLFGGFIGGVAGGALSSAILPFMIGKLARLAASVDSILDRLGIGKVSPKTDEKDKDKDKQAPPGLDWPSTLRELTSTFNAITAAFTAAGGDSNKAAEQSKILETPGARHWAAALQTIYALLDQIRLIINGLIQLVPIVVGALAFVITRLDTLKLAFVDILAFLLRNTLLLRAVVLTTVSDTVGAVASLVSQVLGTLATAVDKILGAAFGSIGSFLKLGVEMLKPIAKALQVIVNALLDWLSGPLLLVLAGIADTLIFRLIAHMLTVLPAVIPPLYELFRGGSSPALTSDQLKSLQDAASTPLGGPTFSGLPLSKAAGFPDLTTGLVGDADVFSLPDTFKKRSEEISKQAGSIFSTAAGAIDDIKKQVKAAANDQKVFNAKLGGQIDEVQKRADAISKALAPPATSGDKQLTVIDQIAGAFGDWFSGGGLKSVLEGVTDHFKANPKLPATIAEMGGVQLEKLPVTIEIGSVTVKVKTRGEAGKDGKFDLHGETDAVARLLEDLHELDQRGAKVAGAGPLFPQFSTSDGTV